MSQSMSLGSGLNRIFAEDSRREPFWEEQDNICISIFMEPDCFDVREILLTT